ncbi:MAG: alpha-N-arabinofuranosidase [Lachnospiraceae bacterium]|nr:alpha-N-arabinofuranosidase [Lachnospiraceae bacterium]
MKQFNLLINADDKLGHINREIYGNFTEHLGRCIYNGIYVGEDSDIPNIHGIRKDIVEAFKNIKLPVLRYPGGCFADEYHWKDGIGDKKNRKRIINSNWGNVVEDNSFGTHEFMELCELVGCEPYITGNVGSGTVREMSEWVEYMTFDGVSPMAELRRANGREKPWRLKYFAVGNENWGCGGNMTPEYYADLYKQYSTFCKNHSGNTLFKIACGPSGEDYNWTEVIMKKLKGWDKWMADGIALHFYSVYDWEKKGYATEFDDGAYYELLNTANFIDPLITRHEEIMNRYDPECEVALVVDEWGTWYEVEKGTNPGFLFQQNTMRDAIVAAISLNIFNRHAKRVKMANIAQAVNVLQAIILTEGEKMIKTPTYHVFDLFKEHQDGEAVYCYVQKENMVEDKNTPMISSSASIKDGKMTVTLANCSLTEEVKLSGPVVGLEVSKASARIISGDAHAHNTFDSPENVVITEHKVEIDNKQLNIVLPPCSVCEVILS